MAAAPSPYSKRLSKDFGDLMRFCSQDENHSILVVDYTDDLRSLNVLMKGKVDSPYYNNDAYLELNLKIHADYPKKPPVAIFQTPVWHPNISVAGTVCVDFLEQHNWAWGTTLLMVVEGIQSLLDHPYVHSPLNTDAARMHIDKPDMFRYTVKMWCHVHTSASDDGIPASFKEKLQRVVREAKCSQESALRRLSCHLWVVEDCFRARRST